ncbi:MAG: site-specific integrase [Bacteroidales bacterium]|nr:site-specific integrase [Bacteroidales bacterium]
MAYSEKISDTTYRLVVCNGYDNNGKKLRKRKTVRFSDKLTPKQLQKELNRQLVLFEQEVKSGIYLDGEKITFAEFTKKWFKDYAEINLTPTTIVAYGQKLDDRILPALGHIKMGKLQPTHLLQFYQNLHDPDLRLDNKYIPNKNLAEKLKPYTPLQISNDTNISLKSCRRLKRGMPTDYNIAKQLCKTYKISLKSMFTCSKSKTLSERTIRNHMGVIRSILSTAVKWNVIKDNPMQRIDMKKYQKPKAKYYDDKQVSDMLNALNNEPLILVVMVYLAIDIGLRRSELTGLTWEDVNFKTSQISINKQRHYVVGYGTIKDKTKTEAGVRIVTVSNKVMQLLKQYKNQQIQQRLKLGSAWHNEPYIFVLDDGKAISTNLPYKWFINFLKRHNLPKITFHQLRHTNASLLISEGEDIVTVSGRLGHADKNITLNTYSHLIKSREAQVANKMDEFYAKMNVG